jgi:hypothetical protein
VRKIRSYNAMVSCTYGLLPNPAKVPNFKCRAWWYSIDQEFYIIGE